MMIVDFEIKNQLIKQITEKPYIVNNNKKYVQLNFNFKTEDWNDINKYIIFKVKNKYDRKTKNYLQLMGYQNNVSVIVPSYAIKNNFLIFTVYGENNEKNYRITTEEVMIIMKKSGYTSKTDIYDKDEDVDIFVILTERIDKSFSNVDFEDNNLMFYNDEGRLLKIIPLSFLENYYNKEEIDEKFSKTIVDVDTSELAETGYIVFNKFEE